MRIRSLLCAALLCISAVAALSTPCAAIDLSDVPPATPGQQPVVVIVDKENHVTHLLQNQGGKLVEVFRAVNTTGARKTPTPEGRLLVVGKELDPVWTPPPSIDPKQRPVARFSKNKKNPLGVAWLGMSKGCIGLHGTNDPSSIGKSVSHGCVRHKNEDAKTLYELIPVGSPVHIVARLSDAQLTADDYRHLELGDEIVAWQSMSLDGELQDIR